MCEESWADQAIISILPYLVWIMSIYLILRDFLNSLCLFLGAVLPAPALFPTRGMGGGLQNPPLRHFLLYLRWLTIFCTETSELFSLSLELDHFCK